MGMEDSKPTESPLGMAIASSALLGEIIQVLVDKDIIKRFWLMQAISAAQLAVNSAVPRTEAHAEANLILGALQKRFPVA
jgi:hypothetical protein